LSVIDAKIAEKGYLWSEKNDISLAANLCRAADAFKTTSNDISEILPLEFFLKSRIWSEMDGQQRKQIRLRKSINC